MGSGVSVASSRHEEMGVFEIKNRMREIGKDLQKIEKVAQHIINSIAEMNVNANKLRIMRFVIASLKEEDCVMSSGVKFSLNRHSALRFEENRI